MKKKTVKISIIVLILLVITSRYTYAKNVEFSEPKYTEVYKAYMEMSEKEREKIIAPQKYNIISNDNKNKMINSEKIVLKNYLASLKSSAYTEKSKFSLVDLIKNNIQIKDQKETNSCWAFTSLTSLETNLALKNYNNKLDEKIYDYSERHMLYSETQSFVEGNVNSKGRTKQVSDGGDYYMATAYLTNGLGAIDEKEMPFENNEDKISIKDIQNKEARTTVNDITYFKNYIITKDGIYDTSGLSVEKQSLIDLRKKMKQHISSNGSISAGIYMPPISGNKDFNFATASIYCEVEKITDIEMNAKNGRVPNHAVSIIGWDDDYSKDNFTTKPKENGAWIISNSYGLEKEFTFDEIKNELVKESEEYTKVEQIEQDVFEKLLEWYEENNYIVDRENKKISISIGDKGFFYVSYEDAYIYYTLLGIENAYDEIKYDKIYQLDEIGGIAAKTEKEEVDKDLNMANVFTRNTNNKEYLTSISIENMVQSGTYEVYINPNGTEKTLTKLNKVELTSGSDITLSTGYHTINFAKAYELTGNNFVVVVKQKSKENENLYFTVEGVKEEPNAKANAGESFIYYGNLEDNSKWIDITDSKNNNTYVGNLCIKAIVVNNYTGEIANLENNSNNNNNVSNQNTKPNENPIPEQNTIPIENTTPNGNIIENTKVPVNSDFSKANASITDFSVVDKEVEPKVCFNVKITGIKIGDLNNQYEHYYYITSNSNDNNITEDKWTKCTSLKKEEDGTYSILIEIKDEAKLKDLEENKDAFIYIREIAKNGDIFSTIIFNAIKLTININVTNNSSTNKDNNILENKNDNTIKQDSTLANKNILPFTGIKTTVLVIGIFFIIFVISYIKYRNMKDIK